MLTEVGYCNGIDPCRCGFGSTLVGDSSATSVQRPLTNKNDNGFHNAIQRPGSLMANACQGVSADRLGESFGARLHEWSQTRKKSSTPESRRDSRSLISIV